MSPTNRLKKEGKVMRKIILLVAVFCLSTMLFADTAKSKSATLKFDMTGENYKFGFAENLDNAKSGTESTEFVINDDETKTGVKVNIDNLSAFKDLANSLIDKYAVPTEATETFKSEPEKAEKFLVPTALEADGAKEAKVEATENGYKVTITLVSETVDYKTAPKYNTQASLRAKRFLLPARSALQVFRRSAL